MDYVADVLYPEDYDGSQPYTNWYTRAVLAVTEFAFTCNTYYLNTAFNNNTYGYEFNIFPAFHGQDVENYTFYNDQGYQPQILTEYELGVIPNAALTLQDWIVSFTRNGTPTVSDVAGVPDFPLFGPNALIEQLNENGTVIVHDDSANWRCAWWQKALYV